MANKIIYLIKVLSIKPILLFDIYNSNTLCFPIWRKLEDSGCIVTIILIGFNFELNRVKMQIWTNCLEFQSYYTFLSQEERRSKYLLESMCWMK